VVEAPRPGPPDEHLEKAKADSASKASKTPANRTPKKPKKKADEEDDVPEPVAKAAPAPPPPNPPKAEAPKTGGTGTLTLVTEPAGLLVTLSGQEIGTTPMFNKTVPAGRQVFKLFAPSGEARTLSLDIKAGQPNSARQDFDALSR
jgi:hypothetical protein